MFLIGLHLLSMKVNPSCTDVFALKAFNSSLGKGTSTKSLQAQENNNFEKSKTTNTFTVLSHTGFPQVKARVQGMW